MHRGMKYEPISIRETFTRFSEIFQPKVIARMNDYEFKLGRANGDFVWHSHPESDEVFLIIEGELTIEFRDGSVKLKPGEMFVVPRGEVHKPVAESARKLDSIEPVGSGDTGGSCRHLRAPN